MVLHHARCDPRRRLGDRSNIGCDSLRTSDPRGNITFSLGMGLWLVYLSYYLRPDKVVERKCRTWDRWVESGIITKGQLRP